jgi:hypothetical protein
VTLTESQQAEDEAYVIRDYTEAFVVRKTIRRLGRVHIPLREGLLVSDVKVFGTTLIIWLFVFGLVINSLVTAVGTVLGLGRLSGIPYLLVLLTPPLVATFASRTPVRHRMTITGLVRTGVRQLLDDPVHRRGVPVRPDPTPVAYRIVVWTPDEDRLPRLASAKPIPFPVQRRPIPGTANKRR